MFTKPDIENLHLIEGQYKIGLVLLSFIIAFGASYTAVFINQRIKGKGFFHKNVWLALASLAMGLGIWSMHFVGMSAYQLPIPVTHNILMTFVSILPAIGASYIAFYLANSIHKRLATFISAGVFMGIGIASMHYLGMAAMQIDAYYVYDFSLFMASVIVATLTSFVALYIFSINDRKMDKIWVKLVIALLMSLSVTSMHYIGMLAINIYIEGPLDTSAHRHLHAFDLKAVVAYVTVGIISLFALSYLASKFDKYVDYRLKNFDSLTELPNQNQFTEDQRTIKDVQLVAIIHVYNLEKFISAYGYTFGDAIVINILDLIKSILPPGTKIYRTEANRFTIVQTEGIQNVMVGLQRICTVLQHPFLVNERMITIEMVCAVSQSQEKKVIHEHFANAIAVLQAPTTQFKGEVILYNPKVHTFNFERQLTLDIQRAIEENELFIVYQPKVDPASNIVVGLEALIRWKHPVYGMISPGVFIPILEKAEKISDVTDWLIDKVCQQLASWNESHVHMQQVSINIPGMYLTSPKLSHVINESLLKYRINPAQVELEITETSVIHDIQNAILAVRGFREKGLSVALDDFGTGLSSLSYLKEIPISTIKIDKSFVDGVPHSKKDAAILTSIIHLSHSLDLHIVIEGVETEEQIRFIRALEKVPVVQGYYYAKPLTAEEIEVWQQNQEMIEV